MDLNEMNGNWQDEAPTLAAMKKANPFTVPEGYFQEMEEQLKSRTKITDLADTETVFTVPVGYFKELQDKIISVTRLESAKSDGYTAFNIPQSYFETLEDRIKNRIQSEIGQASKPAVRRLFSKWSAYAAAACITAVISIGLYFNLKTNSNNIEAKIAALPTEEIVDYLQLYSDAGDAAVIIENLEDESALSQLGPEISEQEIEQYLKLNL